MRVMCRRYQVVPARRAGLPSTLPMAEIALTVVALGHSLQCNFGASTQKTPRIWGPLRVTALLGLADLESDEPGHGHACLVEQRLDGLLVVGHRRLIEQHNVLMEAGHATLDDLGQRLLRLALVAGGLLGDATLVGDDVLRHILTRQV